MLEDSGYFLNRCCSCCMGMSPTSVHQD